MLIEYRPEYEGQLVELIRRQHRLVPLYLDLSDQEIRNMLDHTNHFLELRFPGENGDYHIYLHVVGNEIACAAQIKFIRKQAYFFWMVGNPKYADRFPDFVQRLKDECASKRVIRLSSIRNIFGAGWDGIPDCWGEILEVLIAQGFTVDDRWQSYWRDGGFQANGSLPEAEVELEFENERTIECRLFANDTEVGEAAVWLPSGLSESLNEYGMADIEWITIHKKYRNKGYGRTFLIKIGVALQAQGYDKFMLWTELDNIPMQKLAEATGFRKGPIFHWMHADLDR